MAPVAKTLALIAAAVVGPSLITYKSDQQSIHVLEGRLFRLGGDMGLAAGVYRKHRRRTSDGLIVAGFVLIAAAICLYGAAYPWFPAPGLLGVALTGAGIWGMCRSYAAALKEIDELAASSKGQEE